MPALQCWRFLSSRIPKIFDGQGKTSKSEALSKIYPYAIDAGFIDRELDMISNSIQVEARVTQNSSYRDCFRNNKRRNRFRTWTALIFAGLQQFSGQVKDTLCERKLNWSSEPYTHTESISFCKPKSFIWTSYEANPWAPSFYGPTFFSSIGIDNPFTVLLIFSAVECVSIFPGLILVDKLGRRPLAAPYWSCATSDHFNWIYN